VLATHPAEPGAPEMTRRYVRYGASPRAAQAILLAAKITAALAGHYNVAHEDVRTVAVHALRHRLILNFEAQAHGVQPEAIVQDLLDHVAEGT
jgi:MoxR-like ATPase